MLSPYPPFRAVLDVLTAAHYAWSMALQQEAFRTFGDVRAEAQASHRQPGEAERRNAKREGGAPARPRPGHGERPVAPAGKPLRDGPGARARHRPDPRPRAVDRQRPV